MFGIRAETSLFSAFMRCSWKVVRGTFTLAAIALTSAALGRLY